MVLAVGDLEAVVDPVVLLVVCQRGKASAALLLEQLLGGWQVMPQVKVVLWGHYVVLPQGQR
ncbi:hypothetical protein [Pseudogulbenkiania sp. MAI-1]|uniref:hypothetical protein n=1 Tax=Pseudogulbenkiania sp. MAI-1 TaxID=990370 RepID=UPI00045EA98E|nr:hypothetical protein [Pseudogulbenkiania sp. MAI-1]